MELDFGGIGEQYAVNRAYDLAVARRSNPFLINFSGDLRANRPLASGGDDFKWIRRALGYGMASATAYVRLRENVHCLSDTVAAGRDRNRYGSAHDES
jgi:thiamine biosynthesis lipoprotein